MLSGARAPARLYTGLLTYGNYWNLNDAAGAASAIDSSPNGIAAVVGAQLVDPSEVRPSSVASGVEQGRDPLDELGLGAVFGAHLYRVNVRAGWPPRDIRGVGVGLAMRSLGARWL